MKNSLLPLAGFLSLALTTTASAQVIAEETFDYTAGSLLSATGSAPGWGSGWKADPGLTTDLSSDYNVFATSLTSNAYTSQGLSPQGNQFRIDASSQRNMYRGLSDSISWNANSTFYISTLVRWSGNSASTSSNLTFEIGSGQATFGFSGNGSNNDEMRLRIRNIGGASNDVFSAGSFAAAANQSDREETAFTYMLVVKVETSNLANGDVISLNLYEPNDTLPTTEPLTWDVVNEGTRTGSIDYIGWGSRVFFGGRTAGFDEFRIGNSFASVTVPEPTSAAMLLGAAGFLLYQRRR